MPWEYIQRLLGPGLHWGHPREKLLAAIQRAELDGQAAAAEHLRIILERRDIVNFDAPQKEAPPGWS